MRSRKSYSGQIKHKNYENILASLNSLKNMITSEGGDASYKDVINSIDKVALRNIQSIALNKKVKLADLLASIPRLK